MFDSIAPRGFQSHECNDIFLSFESADLQIKNIDLIPQNRTLVSKVFILLFDILSRSIANLRTIITRSLARLKRTEMREFVDSHKGSYNLSRKLKMSQVQDLQIYIPFGFKGNYLKTIKLIQKMMTQYDMQRKLPELRAAIEKLYRAVMNESKEELEAVHSDFATFFKDDKQRAIDHKEFNRIFTEKRTTTVKFTDVYKSVTEFNQTSDIILELDKYILQARSIENDLNRFEQAFDNIIDCIQDNTTYGKKEIMFISSVAQAIGMFFSRYGDILLLYTFLEHNQVLNIQKMIEIDKAS